MLPNESAIIESERLIANLDMADFQTFIGITAKPQSRKDAKTTKDCLATWAS